ncbi:MAG: hypothetical protein GXY11_03060 [Clostridiales bacterium]|nr:hypothetical protein [Clostridiales bacterium]
MQEEKIRKVCLSVLAFLLCFSLFGCAGETPDATEQPTPAATAENGSGGVSGEAPRTDTPLYPDATLVHEKKYKIAVEEMYATDAAVADVIAFYADLPEFKKIEDTMNYMDDEGAYLETPLMKLLKDGSTVQEEIAGSGPLMYIMILPSDSKRLGGMVGEPGITEKLPPGKTIISLRILTEY